MFRELQGLPEDSAKFSRQRDRIVERCLPLADHIARRFDGRGEPRDDLVQVARVGLVNAVIRFNVDAGSDFVSFAVPTIMGEVRRHFRDNSWSVKVPRRLKELHLRLGAATADLSQRLGRAPTPTELAAELDMDRDEVVEGLVAGSSYNTLSIDSGGGSGNEDAPAIADTLGDVDLSLDQIENREALRPLLEALPERERTVLVLRFFESLTQTQIAERVGISQMHVSRLLAKSLTRLRDQLAVADAVRREDAPAPAGIVAAIGRAESGSQIRISRLTALLGTSTHSTPAPAQRTFSVCSAEKPAVPKKSTPVRSSARRSRALGIAQRVVDEFLGVGRVQITVCGDHRDRRVQPPRRERCGVALRAVDGTRCSDSSTHLCVTPSVEEISDCGSRQKFKALGTQSPSVQGASGSLPARR